MYVSRGSHLFNGINYTPGMSVDVSGMAQYMINNLVNQGHIIDVTQDKADLMQKEHEEKVKIDIVKKHERDITEALQKYMKAQKEVDRLESILAVNYREANSLKKIYDGLSAELEILKARSVILDTPSKNEAVELSAASISLYEVKKDILEIKSEVLISEVKPEQKEVKTRRFMGRPKRVK